MSTQTINPLVGQEALFPPINKDEKGVLERTVCISIEFGGIGNRKRVSTSLIDVPLNGFVAPARTEPETPEPEPEQLTITAVPLDPDALAPWETDPNVIPEESQAGRRGLLIHSGHLNGGKNGGNLAAPICDQPVLPDSEAKKTPGVDKSMLGVSKMLLDSPHLKAIRKHDGRIRTYVYQKCLPYKVGIHLLPIELVTVVEQQLKIFAEERELLVNAFLEAYPKQIEESSGRLLVLFNPADYKEVQAVRAAFRLEWQYISFGTPGRLKDISPALFAAEQEKAAKKWGEATDAIKQVLRAQMLELVDKIQEKLKPSQDGKQKTLRKENLDNLREFIETFDIRNVTSDGDLTALVQRAKTILGNTAAEDVRSDETLRNQMAESFAQIKTELDQIVTTDAMRQISFDEDGV